MEGSVCVEVLSMGAEVAALVGDSACHRLSTSWLAKTCRAYAYTPSEPKNITHDIALFWVVGIHMIRWRYAFLVFFVSTTHTQRSSVLQAPASRSKKQRAKVGLRNTLGGTAPLSVKPGRVPLRWWDRHALQCFHTFAVDKLEIVCWFHPKAREGAGEGQA